MDPKGLQTRKMFFGQQNEAMLYGILAKNFQQRLASQLNDRQSARLEKTVEHYMNEVFEGNPSVPVQALNKEVISAAAADFNAYIQRQDAVAIATPQMFQETSNRFEQIQGERQRSLEAPRPPAPEYIKPIVLKEDESTTALTLFEEAKKRRNLEMSQQAESQLTKRAAAANEPVYLQDQLAVRPDPRAMFEQPIGLVTAGEAPGRGDVNPTLARADRFSVPAVRGPLQQDVIIKQQDIQSYKETEYNLSIFSADRQWELNSAENRYNFTVNLNATNNTGGLSIAPKATARFRNIVRVEFVKAVMPIEGLDTIMTKISQNYGETNTDLYTTVFGLQYVTLNVNELDTNNYGTSNTMDNAFGILQYDANWISDPNSSSRGFTSFIPKHMKCQRVYAPTPLATLNKLTIALQRPDGTAVSSAPDTLDISGIFFSEDLKNYYALNPETAFTLYYNPSPPSEYIWIDTKLWFSKFTVNQGDRIVIRNLNPFTSPTAAQQDFFNYMQRPQGHLVVDIASTIDLSGGAGIKVYDGANSVGYAKFIIIRNQFADPSTGSTDILPFGGQPNNTTLAASILTHPFNGTPTTGRLLNLSHQTQLIFRVITRDYDSSGLIRPDNL